MRRALPLLLLLTVGLSGCANQSSVVPLKVRDRNYQRVVSLSPGTTEIVCSTLMATQKLVGITRSCNWPDSALKGKAVVAGVKPDYEKLKATNPDFIVYDASLYSEGDIAKLKELGATTFGFTAKNLNQYKTQLFELANFLGGASYVSTYWDKVRSESTAALALAPENRKKVAVVMPGPNGSDMVLGTDGFIAEMIRSTGGEPVGPKADKFVPLTPETLVALDPDIIIVPASNSTDTKGAEMVMRDARFRNLKAVKNGKVRAILGDVLLRMGARVDLCLKGLSAIING